MIDCGTPDRARTCNRGIRNPLLIRLSYGCIPKLVGERGFEPPTSCSRSKRSASLSYSPLTEIGTPPVNRTPIWSLGNSRPIRWTSGAFEKSLLAWVFRQFHPHLHHRLGLASFNAPRDLVIGAKLRENISGRIAMTRGTPIGWSPHQAPALLLRERILDTSELHCHLSCSFLLL